MIARTVQYGIVRFPSIRAIRLNASPYIQRALHCARVNRFEAASQVQELDPDDEDLFQFTSGRFVAEEQFAMSQNYIRFNVEALAHVAAEAIDATLCTRIEKYLDGMYNKHLLLTINNGIQTIAKILYLNAGKAHFITASEVAIMEFVGFFNLSSELLR